jgi:hypothetical protein
MRKEKGTHFSWNRGLTARKQDRCPLFLSAMKLRHPASLEVFEMLACCLIL